MKISLKERFREVDVIPTPWDGRAAGTAPLVGPTRGGRGRAFVFAAAAAAAAAAVIALALVVLTREQAPHADVSWLVNAQASCIEQYSPGALANRSYAFEGVITDVRAPVDPESPDPSDLTSTITFDVVKWFWGGSGAETSRQTYATASSAGELDGSVGARLLVSGDGDFVWACGFTQPVTDQGRADFEGAAGAREDR